MYDCNQDLLRLLIEKADSPLMRDVLTDLPSFLAHERGLIEVHKDMSEADALIALTRVLPGNIHITTPTERRPRNTIEIAARSTEFTFA